MVLRALSSLAFFSLFGSLIPSSDCFSAFSPSILSHSSSAGLFLSHSKSRNTLLSANNKDENTSSEDEAERLQNKASELREQIRKMEEQLGEERKRNYEIPSTNKPPEQPDPALTSTGKSLRRKRVLVVGANGRLGSMVCRYLLRNHPDTEVVAAVHYVGEQRSYTSRGFGRLSYEVGAEDGAGTIGAAWSAEDRVATFEYTSDMKSYNLQNLRVVEVELLDPVQCTTITEDVDSVIWCATDFNGNQPRAISGLNIAFLFRAVADPTKGRVEIEGIQNILRGLKKNLQDKKWRASGGKDTSRKNPNDPINFVLVSTAPGVFGEFETPFGEFNGLKRQGEQIVEKDFPSLSHAILQFGRFEDNFVEEDLELLRQESASSSDSTDNDKNMYRLRINRRDAARAAVEALTDESLEDKTVKVWTALRG